MMHRIKEEFEIPGTDIIIEVGDVINIVSNNKLKEFGSIDASSYMKTNIPRMLMDMVKNFKLYGIDPKTSLNNKIQDIRNTDYRGLNINMDISVDEMVEMFKSYVRGFGKNKTMTKLVYDKLHFTTMTRSFKDLMQDQKLSFLNKVELESWFQDMYAGSI